MTAEDQPGTIVEAELVGSHIEWIAEYPDGWRLAGEVTAGGGNTHITNEGLEHFAEAMIGAEVEPVDRSLYEESDE